MRYFKCQKLQKKIFLIGMRWPYTMKSNLSYTCYSTDTDVSIIILHIYRFFCVEVKGYGIGQPRIKEGSKDDYIDVTSRVEINFTRRARV